MADLTVANVTIERAWSEGGTHGKDLSCRQVTLVCTAAGGTTAGNQIPASVLQLSKIEQAGLFIDSTDANIYQGSPNFAGTLLLFADAENAAAGSHMNTFGAAGITATVRGVVKGYL